MRAQMRWMHREFAMIGTVSCHRITEIQVCGSSSAHVIPVGLLHNHRISTACYVVVCKEMIRRAATSPEIAEALVLENEK